jgi:hypothetical protein
MRARFGWVLSLVLGGLLLTVMSITTACDAEDEDIRGSGELVTRTFDLEGFDAVEASYSFDVEITRDDAFSVEVTVDDNIADRLEVELRRSTLELSLEPGLSISNVTLRAVVTMPELTSVEASGASRIAFEGFDGPIQRFDVRVSGASNARGDLQVDALLIDASGASTVELTGRAADLDAEASGASGLELRGLEAVAADLRVSGASRAELTVTDALDLDVTGVSRVRYAGDPVIGRLDISGASSVDHED